MVEQQLKPCVKNLKNPESKKGSPSSNNSASKKQARKKDNPTRFLPPKGQPSDFGLSTTWVCKNSACRALLPIEDAFCRRCSCCICHQFDDNKDPSLWLVCESESPNRDSCGLSCHIECAIQQAKAGVVNLGQYMPLDGSYCCASCGKVQQLLGCWKKQLAIAKDARRVDVLCYRIFLSYRLLEGTSKFKEFHEIIVEAKTKLEGEVGPMHGDSVKMVRGIVSRLSVASDIQKLCSHAIEKADEWLANVSSESPNFRVDSLPAACRFLFEEVDSSSLALVLVDIPSPFTDKIKGYKLWYSESSNASFPKEPASIVSREMRRIKVKSLLPCTEYTFRIVSYTEAGDLGHSEAKCFTKSVEVFNKNLSPDGSKKENSDVKEQRDSNPDGNAEFKVRELGDFLHLVWDQERGSLEEVRSGDKEQCLAIIKYEPPKDHQSPPPVSRELDLNVASVPDLNEDLTPPVESSRDEDNGFMVEERANGPHDDAASHGIENNGLARPNGSGPSDNSRKRALCANEEAHSALISWSPNHLSSVPGPLDENFEYCVKIIRQLECQGYVRQEFRLKLLTWFSLGSTEQERRVVHTFIQTLADDPKSLAGQLVDSFSDIVLSKKPRNGFTGALP